MSLTTDLTGPLPRLCFITDPQRTGGRPLAKVVERVCRGGCRMVQVRAPGLADRELYLLARQLTHIANSFGALAIINDRIDICHAVGAQGVHLGASDLPLRVARPLLGPDKLLGYSAHALKELRRAGQEGADYVTFSPLFPLTHKASPHEPWGIAGYAEALRHVTLPVYALGGVRESHLADLITAGDARHPVHLAATALLSEAPDISAATEATLRALHPEWDPAVPFTGEARYTFDPADTEDWDVGLSEGRRAREDENE